MEEELNLLETNDTWSLVKLPPGRKAMKSKWVYRLKYKLDGSVDRLKARLVVKGCSQKEGIDYEETFSPVMRYDSIRTILSVAASEDLEMIQFDVKTAFLHGDLEEQIFMVQPEGFQTEDGKVCLLLKSLYGLKQAPRCWNKKFTSFLEEFKLKATDADPCVFVSTGKEKKIILALYVDDGICCCSDREVLDKLVKALKTAFEIMVGDCSCFVGIEIKRNRTKRQMFLSQETYARKILNKYNMSDAHAISVPADPHVKLCKDMHPRQDEGLEDMNNFPYRAAIGHLMYLMTCTRPDLAYAVSTLSQFMVKPNILHWRAVQRVLRYLKGTTGYGITFMQGNKKHVLSGFSDSDFAGDIDERKSTSGYVFLLNNGPVTWRSRRQRMTAISSTEAEYVSCSESSREAVWLRRLLSNIGFDQDEATVIHVDNMSAISLVKNPSHHSRTKHIDTHFNLVRQYHQRKFVDIHYVPTEEQVADILTMAVTPGQFSKLRTMMGINQLQS